MSSQPEGPLSTLAGLFDHPFDPSLDLPLSLGSDWEALLQHLPVPTPALNIIPSLGSFMIQSSPFVPALDMDSLPLTSTGNLTSGQASLLKALFSLGETNSSPQSARTSFISPTQSSANSPSYLQSYYNAPLTSNSGSHLGITSVLNLYDSASKACPSSQNEDDEDVEDIKEILCSPLVWLDRSVDSNSLSFVLQSYAQWIPLALFDPLKIVHQARQIIIGRFPSPSFRSRVLLISHLMRALVKSWVLDEGGKRTLELLRGEISATLMACVSRESRRPVSEEERQGANSALSNTLELLSIQIVSSPLSSALRVLQLAAPVFLMACPLPHPPHLPAILLEPGIDFRHFVAMDIAFSVTTGRPTFCRYYVPWSLELCENLMRKQENQGLQWLCGIPDQFILLLAYMNGLRQGAPVTEEVVQQLEDDIRAIRILPVDSKDASLKVGKMVVQECWRSAVLIYLYMALCGAAASDLRVENATRAFMKLVNGIKPGRNPDAFLVIPMIIVGVATTKPVYRRKITSRILTTPECAQPNTAGNDSLRMLEDIWTRTSKEGRAPRWQDLREACRRITGA